MMRSFSTPPRPTAVLACLTLCLAAAPLAAQLGPGDAVFGGSPPTVIHRDGTFTTLAALPGRAEITAMVAAPDNQGFVVSLSAFPAKPVLAVYDAAGVVTTLYRSWILPTPWELMVDSRGNLVVVGTTMYGQTGFGELHPNGSFELVYEALVTDSNNAQPLRAMLDPWTDEVVVVTPHGEILRIERKDPIHINTIATSAIVAFPGAVRPHPHADKLLVEGVGGDFLVLDRFTGATTTLHAAPSKVKAVTGWDVDPFKNALVVHRLEDPDQHVLLSIDLDTGVTTVIRQAATGPEPRPMALHGTRILAHHAGTPTPGSAYEMRVSFPGHAGADYVMAASLSPAPGFDLLGRHIPLEVQPALTYSLITPAIFQNFIGKLDATASAVTRVQVQQTWAGLRIYFAAVCLKGGVIQGVSLPFGVTVNLAP